MRFFCKDKDKDTDKDNDNDKMESIRVLHSLLCLVSFILAETGLPYIAVKLTQRCLSNHNDFVVSYLFVFHFKRIWSTPSAL